MKDIIKAIWPIIGLLAILVTFLIWDWIESKLPKI